MAHAMPHTVYVHGAAIQAGWEDATANLTDLIFRGVSAALSDAGIVMADIDSVVLASHDLVDGRSLSSMVTAPAAGAYLRDEIRLTDDGLAAVSLGAARIEAGESEMTIVAAWGRASEGDYQHVGRWSFDPFHEQSFAMDDMSVSAMRMSAWLGQSGNLENARARANEARGRRASANSRGIGASKRPVAVRHPLAHSEAPLLADIVVAAVLGKRPSAVRITGIGHGTELPSIGERKLLEMTALRTACDAAARSAGTSLGSFDVYEFDGGTLSDEALTLEALGLAAPGGGFDQYASDERFNPSGGGAAAWSYPTNGLMRFAEAYLQLRGDAGANQLQTAPRSALATGLSPIGAQTAVAVALGVV